MPQAIPKTIHTMILTAVAAAAVSAAFRWAWPGPVDSPGSRLVYLCAAYAASMAFFPISILITGSGVLFGFIHGFWVATVFSLLSAGTAFLSSRYWLRDWVHEKIENQPRFRLFAHAVKDEGWRAVALTRLSPVFPFAFLNYFFGLAHISFKAYFFSTLLAMLPGIALCVYWGSLAGELAGLRASSGPMPGKGYSVLLAVAGTLLLFWTVTYRIRKLTGEPPGGIRKEKGE